MLFSGCAYFINSTFKNSVHIKKHNAMRQGGTCNPALGRPRQTERLGVEDHLCLHEVKTYIHRQKGRKKSKYSIHVFQCYSWCQVSKGALELLPQRSGNNCNLVPVFLYRQMPEIIPKMKGHMPSLVHTHQYCSKFCQ